ncbi:hypothetical protein [Haploplasma axanthum]|uniref:Uncharacterized protein n=1 Tax=Haploplasma axanthum TaxID=29552 RepID=A0A449BBQ1_HAPAX|nr:hypothetical protein [Haploplasma axanthum]VEU79868.1 Uncharacterised protein [Haploplasma axanthum]
MRNFMISNIYFILGLLIVVIIILAVVILLLTIPKKEEKVPKTLYTKTNKIIFNSDLRDESEAIINDDLSEENDLKLSIKYNYSFQARMHLAPIESQQRFSELKNYLLAFPNVDVKKSWKYERFMHKGKPVLKMWIHGNNLKVYYNISPQKLYNKKYNVEDVSYARMHETTPSLLIVNGPRLLEYAKELIDMYMMQYEKINKIPTVDYTVGYIDKNKLIEMKLIKIVN